MSILAVVLSVISGLVISIGGGLVVYVVQRAGLDRREDAANNEKRLKGLEDAVHLLREALIALHPEMLEWLRSRGDRD